MLWSLTTISAVALLFGYHTSTSSLLPTAGGKSTARQSTPSTTSTPAAPVPGQTQVTGAVASTRWGPVQVRITVANKRITAVDVLQQPDSNGKDREINADAVPELIQETMTAQSAKIDMISGATVTSEGYVNSLQSALDQAGMQS